MSLSAQQLCTELCTTVAAHLRLVVGTEVCATVAAFLRSVVGKSSTHDIANRALNDHVHAEPRPQPRSSRT